MHLITRSCWFRFQWKPYCKMCCIVSAGNSWKRMTCLVKGKWWVEVYLYMLHIFCSFPLRVGDMRPGALLPVYPGSLDLHAGRTAGGLRVPVCPVPEPGLAASVGRPTLSQVVPLETFTRIGVTSSPIYTSKGCSYIQYSYNTFVADAILHTFYNNLDVYWLLRTFKTPNSSLVCHILVILM